MYRGRFLLFPGRRRNRISLSRTLWRHFFIEGAHLGFLQFVERQLFLFFPQSSRERKRDLFPRKSTTTHARRVKKREKGTHKTHTERDTERKKCACVCERECARRKKWRFTWKRCAYIITSRSRVFFLFFFPRESNPLFLLFLRLSFLLFLVADAQTL